MTVAPLGWTQHESSLGAPAADSPQRYVDVFPEAVRACESHCFPDFFRRSLSF